MNTMKDGVGAGRGAGIWKRLGWIVALALFALPAVAAADNAEKQVAKLEKKVAAKEASVAAKQAKLIDLQAQLSEQEVALVDAQLALEEAEALPQDTPEEVKAANKAIKAANKAIHRASKRMDKLAARIAKIEEKIANQLAQLDELAALIDALTPGGLPDVGDVNVDGLELPEQVSFVQAVEDEDNGDIDTDSGHQPAPAAGHGLPGDSPFFTDESHTWVYDPSMESLGTVNQILCMLRQSAYDQMVNQGAYTAQVDPALCDDGGSQDSQDGEVEEVELWTVNSVRTDDDTAHVVGVWVPQAEGNGPGGGGAASTINARMEIIEEPSAENPFGLFAMDFEAIPVDDPDGVPLFWGTLETQDAVAGTMGFSFFEVGSEPEAQFEQERAVHVQVDAQGNGLAQVSDFQQGPFGPGGSIEVKNDQYLLAFDDFNLLRTSDGIEETCLSRTEFETTAWRYNLYYANGDLAGQRVERNSGFGISTEDGHYGWVGYHGLWLPEEAQITSGDVVLKNTWDVGDSPEQFTVLQTPGKLYRNTRKALELAEVDGMTFEWWDFSQGGDPQSQPSQFLVTYQHGTGEFLAIAQKQGESFVDLPQPVVLDTATIGWLSMWSSALGGNVVYVHGESGVTYFQEEIVTGNDAVFEGGATVDLYGWVDVLAPNLSGSDAQAGQVFLPVSQDVQDPYLLVFDHDDLGLYLDDGVSLEPVGLADGETYQGGPFHWGMRSGPMVTDPNAVSDVFNVWNQEVFYVWETGPNTWNRLTTLIDEVGDYVEFDPPLQFSYVHEVENDIDGGSDQVGNTFLLEFNGPGELQGIPHEGVDLDGDGHEDRWYPLFGLADGTKVGPTGTEYLVRAMEKEQRLAIDAQGCQSLDLSGAEDLALPDGSSFELPNLGEQPVVDGPPAVISGVVQDTDG